MVVSHPLFVFFCLPQENNRLVLGSGISFCCFAWMMSKQNRHTHTHTRTRAHTYTHPSVETRTQDLVSTPFFFFSLSSSSFCFCFFRNSPILELAACHAKGPSTLVFLLKKTGTHCYLSFLAAFGPNHAGSRRKKPILQTYAIRLLQPAQKCFFFFGPSTSGNNDRLCCRHTTQNLASLPTGGENSFPSADLFPLVCLIFIFISLFVSPHCPLMTSSLTPENVPNQEGEKGTFSP